MRYCRSVYHVSLVGHWQVGAGGGMTQSVRPFVVVFRPVSRHVRWVAAVAVKALSVLPTLNSVGCVCAVLLGSRTLLRSGADERATVTGSQFGLS